MNFFFKVKKFIKILLSLEFKIPTKKEFLIFDDLNSEYLKHYIGSDRCNVLSFRNNNFNFFGLFYSLLFFYKSNFKIEYINFYLLFSKKKTIITLNYNRLILLNIKNYYSKVKVIIIQNGISTQRFIDLMKKSKFNLCCDLFLCTSKIEKKIFSKYIKSKFLVLGTLKNNYYKKQSNNKKREILFISQYRKYMTDPFVKNYIFTEENLLKTLAIFCLNNKLKLSILPSKFNYKLQLLHYKEILKNFTFKLYKKNNNLSYKRIDKSLIVVGVDSTLVYESLSRGNKTGIFQFGLNIENSKYDESFISKYYFSETGKFWLKYLDKVKILNILNYLLFTSQKKWNDDTSSYQKILPFDQKNSILVEAINNIN